MSLLDIFEKNETTMPSTLTSTTVNSTVTVYTSLSPTTSLVNKTSMKNIDHSLNNQDFYIGLGLAMSSSLFIGSSFILKKKALTRLADRGMRAGDGGYGYLMDWVWWSGMILMAAGEMANFAAYAFAPATMVTPLGALSVLVTAVLSSKFLDERLNLLGKLGCFLCVTGSTMVVLHAPKEQEIESMNKLMMKVITPGFIVYVACVLLISAFCIFYLGPRYGHKNPLVFITVTASVGSLTVMACKGVGVAIKDTMATSLPGQFANWFTWMTILFLGLFVSIQMVYLNKALDIFNASVVTPILYVFFTLCVILASAILFQEWMGMSLENVLGNTSGFLTIVMAIVLLNGFKDLDLTLEKLNLQVLRTESTSEDTNAGGVVSSARTQPASIVGGGAASGYFPRLSSEEDERTSLLRRPGCRTLSLDREGLIDGREGQVSREAGHSLPNDIFEGGSESELLDSNQLINESGNEGALTALRRISRPPLLSEA